MFQVKESLTMIEEFLINVPSDMIVYEINHNIGVPKKSVMARQTHLRGLAKGERSVA
jgi:hypothetical protein